MYGKRYYYEVTETYGREGMCFDGEKFMCPRDRVTMEFEDGKVAYFDFRTRHNIIRLSAQDSLRFRGFAEK